MPRPIILGVVGDSAAGKTTITRGLLRILGEHAVTHVCTDDYHRYDRRQRKQHDITPLHPDCNYIDVMGRDIGHLRRGEAILKPVYRHADGTFAEPDRRGPDSAGFIRPQQRFADVVVTFLPGRHGDAPERLDARLVLRDGLVHPDLTPFVGGDSGITLEPEEGARRVRIPGDIDPERAAHIERAIWDAMPFASH